MAIIPLKDITFPNLDNTYTIPEIDDTLSTAGKAADAKKTGDEIDGLKEDLDELNSNFTDMGSDGVVPSTEQILTDKGITDSVPYHYRKTGGDRADRLYDQIVGGTVCFNQLAKEANKSGSITFDADTTAYHNKIGPDAYINIVSGHKYYISANISRTISGNNQVSITLTGGIAVELENGDPDGVVQTIRSANTNIPSGSVAANNYAGKNGFSAGDTVSYDDYKLLDLTQMFGSTIADYIYSLETAHAGDGVAFFKSLFPNDYYPYNAGELKSVEGLVSHDMTGFNQFNKSVATLGKRCKSDGTLETQSNYAVTDYVRVVENMSYYCKDIVGGNAYYSAIFFNENKEVTGSANVSGSGTASGIITIPNGTTYLRCNMLVTNINTVCINLSDPTKNRTYKPYKGHSYPLDSTLTLRGLFKLDANNKLYADGDTYDADGTVTRRYGVVDLGTLTWQTTVENVFYANATSLGYKFYESIQAVCSKYVFGGVIQRSADASTDKAVYLNGVTGNPWVFIRDSSYSDVAAFTAAMSGVMLVYELATPTTEEADPYQHLQQCDPSGTEEYISTGIVPIGHNSFYPENLRAKVEQLPWNFASLIAPTESTFTATRNYVTGDLFIVQNVLYKATSNIANGGTITPNTNCTATTLAEIISALA